MRNTQYTIYLDTHKSLHTKYHVHTFGIEEILKKKKCRAPCWRIVGVGPRIFPRNSSTSTETGTPEQYQQQEEAQWQSSSLVSLELIFKQKMKWSSKRPKLLGRLRKYLCTRMLNFLTYPSLTASQAWSAEYYRLQRALSLSYTPNYGTLCPTSSPLREELLARVTAGAAGTQIQPKHQEGVLSRQLMLKGIYK